MRRLFDDHLLRRIARNTGLLLSGNGVAGILALGSVTVAARGLGAEAFGVLMIFHAYAMIMGGLCRFNVYQAILRYGASCLADQRRRDLQGLLTLGVGVELAGVAAAMALGVVALGWLGPRLGLDEAYRETALWYCLVVIASNGATPIGILRLLDRFALIAWTRPVTPTLRLVGCLAAWAGGAGLPVFAAVWALAGSAEALLLWRLAHLELHRGGWLKDLRLRVRGLVRPHQGLWRMLLWTNLQGTLGMVSGRLATVLVGAMLGPVAAGLYLVAYQVAAVIDRPLQIVRRAVDPEFARLVAAADMATLWRLFRRTLLGTACFAAPLLVVLGLFGDRLLGFFFGEAFAAAHPVLVLLALQTALLALVMPSASVLVMLGHAGRLLLAQAIGRGAQLLALLALMQHFGLVAAGAAGAAAAGLELVLVTGFVLATRRAAAPDAATAAGGCAGR